MLSESSRRRRIRQTSRIVAIVCASLTLLVPLSFFFFALFTSTETLISSVGLSAKSAASVEDTRFVFAIVSLIISLPLSFGFLRLGTCFHGFANDELFARRTISGLRDFAAVMLAWALAQPLLSALASLILTWTAPAGSHEITFKFGSDDLYLSLLALIVLIFSWVLTEAADLSEENAQFV